MKAMVIKEFGGPEVFEARDMPKPEPGPTELLIKVFATSVNPVDYKIRQSSSWAGVQPPAIIGYDASGVVEAVGDLVQDFEAGDEVYYTPEIDGNPGTYAEYHTVDESIVAFKPDNLSHAEAATIPLAGATAWGALIPRANIWLGETVLIHGCGGVGSLGVQIAKAAGARVLITCSDYMLPLAEELGADRAIDYKTEDFVAVVEEETEGEGVHVVFDTVGGETLAQSIPVVQAFGVMVGIVSSSIDLRAAYRKNLTLHTMFMQRDRQQLDVLRTLLEAGQIRPLVDSVMDLEEVAEAHRKLEAGGVRGKIALQVAAE
jgi:NADPH:quinone reductase